MVRVQLEYRESEEGVASYGLCARLVTDTPAIMTPSQQQVHLHPKQPALSGNSSTDKPLDTNRVTNNNSMNMNNPYSNQISSADTRLREWINNNKEKAHDAISRTDLKLKRGSSFSFALPTTPRMNWARIQSMREADSLPDVRGSLQNYPSHPAHILQNDDIDVLTSSSHGAPSRNTRVDDFRSANIIKPRDPHEISHCASNNSRVSDSRNANIQGMVNSRSVFQSVSNVERLPPQSNGVAPNSGRSLTSQSMSSMQHASDSIICDNPVKQSSANRINKLRSRSFSCFSRFASNPAFYTNGRLSVANDHTDFVEVVHLSYDTVPEDGSLKNDMQSLNVAICSPHCQFDSDNTVFAPSVQKSSSARDVSSDDMMTSQSIEHSENDAPYDVDTVRYRTENRVAIARNSKRTDENEVLFRRASYTQGYSPNYENVWAGRSENYQYYPRVIRSKSQNYLCTAHNRWGLLDFVSSDDELAPPLPPKNGDNGLLTHAKRLNPNCHRTNNLVHEKSGAWKMDLKCNQSSNLGSHVSQNLSKKKDFDSKLYSQSAHCFNSNTNSITNLFGNGSQPGNNAIRKNQVDSYVTGTKNQNVLTNSRDWHGTYMTQRSVETSCEDANTTSEDSAICLQGVCL